LHKIRVLFFVIKKVYLIGLFEKSMLMIELEAFE